MRTQESIVVTRSNNIDFQMMYWYDDGEDEYDDDNDNEPGWYGYLQWSTRRTSYGLGEIGPFETLDEIYSELSSCIDSIESQRKRENKPFRLDKIEANLLSTDCNGQWEFGGEPISGTIYEYSVKDRNFRNSEPWVFVIRVPSRLVGATYIEVRPTPHHPQKEYWANIDRQSVNFRKATRGNYRGLVYAKLFLAGVNDAKNKYVARRGERAFLPDYFSGFKLRLKKTVKTTKGNDSKNYVVLAKPKDHLTMIRIFFALKVWTRYSGFSLRE